MAVAFDVSVTAPGGVTEDDEYGADVAIIAYNDKLPKDENGDPINPLPYSNNTERAASLKTVLDAEMLRWFASYVKQGKEKRYNQADRIDAWKSATNAVRDQIDTLLGL